MIREVNMTDYKLFIITEDEITSVEKATPDDTVIILSGKSKKIYVYRGKNSHNFDEFESGELFDRVVNRFLNPKIYLVKTSDANSGDSEEIKFIKSYLRDRIDNSAKYRLTRLLKNIFFLRSYRKNVRYYHQFEFSDAWRNRLSSLTSLRKLSIFNTVAGGIGLIWILILLFGRIIPVIDNPEFLSDQTAWMVWLESMTVGNISLIILIGSVFILNLLFVLFPLRFPIKPYQTAIRGSKKVSKPQVITETKSQDSVTPSPPAVSKLPPKLPKSPPKMPKMPKKSKLPKKSRDSPKKGKFDHQDPEKDEELNIPTPPMRKISGVSKSKKSHTKKIAPPKTPPKAGKSRKILADCPICDKVLHMEIPEDFVKNAEEPVVEITYLHGDPQHSLVVQLDHDFQVRRRRASWVVQDQNS